MPVCTCPFLADAPVKEVIEEEYGFAPVMEWSESGYRFSVFSDLVDSNNLPRGMLNVDRNNKKYIKFTTHELVRYTLHGHSLTLQLKRNARMKQSQQEVFNMSDKFVSSLVQELVNYLRESWYTLAGQLTASKPLLWLRCSESSNRLAAS